MRQLGVVRAEERFAICDDRSGTEATAFRPLGKPVVRANGGDQQSCTDCNADEHRRRCAQHRYFMHHQKLQSDEQLRHERGGRGELRHQREPHADHGRPVCTEW